MEDISLTSPSVTESIAILPTETPKRKRAPPPLDRTVSSALRRLATKPSISKGSENNPIDLDEYSPVRRKPVRPTTKRVKYGPEPHAFLGQHKELYALRPARPALASKTANGVRFTGDKGDDMYRMKKAKCTAVGLTSPVQYQALPPQPQQTHAQLPPPAAQHQAAPPSYSYDYGYDIPFETQYPLSAQYLAHPPFSDANTSSYTSYHNRMNVSLAGDSEDMLRKKAIQFVREYSRPQRHKKVPSIEVDETSASASDSDTTVLAFSQQPRRTKTKMRVYQDPNDRIAPLIAHASLLTSLFERYVGSRDQVGLRVDISLLVGVQGQMVGAWMRAEEGANGVLDAEWRRDEEVRGLLSAEAGIWGDGSWGVADVFGGGKSEESGMDVGVDEDGAVGVGDGGDGVVGTRQDGIDEMRTKGVCGWAMIR